MTPLYVMVWLCVSCGFTEPRAPLISMGLAECRAVSIAWVKQEGGSFICAKVPTGGFIWTPHSTRHVAPVAQLVER